VLHRVGRGSALRVEEIPTGLLWLIAPETHSHHALSSRFCVLIGVVYHRSGPSGTIPQEAHVTFPQGGVSAYSTVGGDVGYTVRLHGIRVNTIAPGMVEIEASAGQSAESKQMAARRSALRRLARPEDIAGAIYLLALGEAGFLTGSYLSVSGGTYMP
jgi:hypothetical protein